MAIEAGRVLSERYRLIRPVGQGSQASVWVAEHLALTTHVAVKLIDPELAKKESARERFRREATAAAQLRSAHVVQILDHGIDDDQPFIVMELLDGEDLFERLAHRNRLSLRETSKIITQVARALSRAHAAHIVHRDLKPENVFLCPNEDDEVVKVLDFGVAKVKDAAKVTMQKTGVGTLIGTPHYMSPEQVKGIGEIDYRADLWALGIIAFQCVTGELPFDSEGVGDLLIKITIGDAPIPSKVYPGASPNFDVWFARACNKDPGKRFQSAREMAVALAGVVGVVDGVMPRAPTVRPPAASAPGITVTPLPRPPRAVTEQLEVDDDWEEIDPFDDEEDAPTRMKDVSSALGETRPLATPLPAQPTRPLIQEAAPRPAAQPAPRAPPPRAEPAAAKPAVKPITRPPGYNGGDAGKAAPAAPRPTTNAPPAPRPAAAPVAVVPASAPPPAPFRAAMESQESHDIVDFDETIPAHDLGRGSIALPLIVRAGGAGASAVPLLAPLSEPPPAPPPPASHPGGRGGAPPDREPPRSSPSAPQRESGHAHPPETPPPSPRAAPAQPWDTPPASAQPALIAPVVMPPPRPALAPPPGEAVPPSIPRPPPSSRSFPPASAGARPSPAPVVTQVEARARTFVTEPPPELDGSSKRRRMVRFMVAGLVLFAAGITWTVVRPLLETPPGPAVLPPTAATSVAPPPPPPPPPPTTTTAGTTATAVDPGKVTHPTKPTPSAPVQGPHKGQGRGRIPKQPNNGEIVVPEPDEDAVPPAP